MIYILYNPLENKVEFRNVTQNTKDTIDMNKIIGNPLYPCVYLYQQNDEVECLGA